MKRRKESKKPLFDLEDKGFNVQAFYLKDTEESKGDALIELRYKGKLMRKLIYPAYKIYNIAAHFSDIVDSEIANNDRGYKIAGSTGLGGVIMPKPVRKSKSQSK